MKMNKTVSDISKIHNNIEHEIPKAYRYSKERYHHIINENE